VEGFPHVSSFGVFDGHFGTIAASVCAQYLHKTILKKISKLSTMEAKVDSGLSEQEKSDAIFCEGARLAYLEIDEGIRAKDKSGCTGISVFLFRNEDDSVRLYCSNVGDSRCVLFSTYLHGMDTAHHSRDEPIDVDDIHGGAQAEENIRSIFYGSNTRKKAGETLVFPLNEDHKLSSPRERSRLEAKSNSFLWRPLPSNAVKSQMILGNAIDESLTTGFNINSLIETGYPHPELLDAASIYVQSITCKEEDVPDLKPVRMHFSTISLPESEDEIYPRCHDESFIDKRSFNGEKVGPVSSLDT
jgi:Protein phosphatase 2C